MSRIALFFTLVILISCSSPVPEIAEEVVTEPTIVRTADSSTEPTVPATRTPRPTWTTIPTNTPQSDTPIPATAIPTVTLSSTEEPLATPEPTDVVIEEPVEDELLATATPSTESAVPTATNTTAPVATTAPPTSVPATAIPATATQSPVTSTSIPATVTQSPPTATTLPPTATPIPASGTPVPPTATTLPPTLPPTATPIPTVTLPPTATSIPATATPIPPTAVPTSASLSIGALGSLPDGQEVTITGNVVNASSFSAGFKFTIADSTGRISMVMFSNTYDDCWDKNVLNVGATVVVTGEIGRFEGELQIVPQWGGGVDVTAPAYAYAQPQTVANLPNVMGQRAMIEGEIIEVDVTESFTKIDVNDGTGVVEVFLWNNIWVRVPNKDALAAGQQLRAVGIVGEFRGTLQLSPPLPYDVVQP